MRVKTLLGDDFIESCHCLGLSVSKSFQPDIVIGVLTGGGYVGREVSKYLNRSKEHIYAEVHVQRKDTKKKGKGLVHKILQTLPYFLLNWLRMAEMHYEVIKAKKGNPKREGVISFSDEVVECLNSNAYSKVLIVDDAIDTGATLKLVKDKIIETYPEAIVRIAVITVTSNYPLIDADYCIFHDRTLVRFPWSNDVKRK